jgi:hypothetical protein
MKNAIASICVLAVLAGCGKEPPPRSVQEFVDDPILLEATMVRCDRDRSATRYDAECVNARDAVDRLAAAREQARRQELEARSEQKRQALRRAQQAAAEARRKAEEAERRREEAEYYGEFESFPPRDDASENPEATKPDRDNGEDRVPPSPSPPGNSLQAEPAASGDSETGEVEEVREELKRGQED